MPNGKQGGATRSWEPDPREIERLKRVLQDSLDTLELATDGGIVASDEDVDAEGAKGKTVVKAESAAWAARNGLEAYRALVALGAAEANPNAEKYLAGADAALWRYADMPLENVYPEMLILDWYGLKALSALAGVVAGFLGTVTARVVGKIGLETVFPRVAGAVVGAGKMTGGLLTITGVPMAVRPFGVEIPGIGWLAAIPMTGLAALQSAAGKKPFAEEFTAHIVRLFGPGGEGVRDPESSSKDILQRMHLSSGNKAVDFLPELVLDLVIMALVGGASQAGKRLAPRVEARMARLPVNLQNTLRELAARMETQMTPRQRALTRNLGAVPIPRPQFPLGKPLPTTPGRVEKVIGEVKETQPGERPKGVPAGPTPTKGGNPIDRGRNTLVFDQPSKTPGSFGRAWDWFMRSWKDKFRPIEQFEKAAGKQIGAEVEAGESPFEVASAMSHASGGKAETWIMDKTIDFDGKVTGKSLAEILEPVAGKERDATLYAYAKHALERWRQGKNPGISWDDATAIVKQMKRPAFDTFAAALAAYNERLADYAIAGGALSPETAAAFREVYESYLPLYRAMGEYARGVRGGRGFGDLPKLYKKAVGGTQQVIDPLASTIQRTQTIISWADRARVGGLIADLIDRAGGNVEGWGRRIEVPRKPTAAELKAALADFEKLGGNTKDLTPKKLDEFLTFWITRVYGLPEQNTIRFFRNGELQVYELDPVLYDSVKLMDAAKLPLWLQLTLGGPRNLTVLGATGLRASFGLVTNFLRDPTTYFMQSEYGGKMPNPFRPLIETFRQGLSKLGVPDTELGTLWRRLGGEQSVWFNADLPKAMKTASDMVKQGRTPATWVKIVLKGGFVVYREAINIPEGGPRRTEFKDAYEAELARTGDARSATIAALNAARRVTVPFTRSGNIGQYVNQIIPFFNPSLQGIFTFADVIRNNPKQVAARGAAMAALTLALWWRNKDDKEIQALPDYDKYGFWHYRIGDTIWRVPRPFEPGYIFAAMPEATAQLAYDHDRKAFVAAFGQSLAAAAPPFMPAGVNTLIEEWANKSLFTGRPIVPAGQLERLPPSQQYSRYTTEIAKWLGAKLGVSPARIEHEISGWTGGLGLDIVQAVDNILAGKPRPFELANLPFISRIVSRSPWVGKFYDIMDEAREEAARLGGRTYRLKALENVADLLRDLRKKELAVDASTVTKEQKVKELTKLRDMIESLARTAVEYQQPSTLIPPKVKAPRPPKVPSLPGHMPIPTGPTSYNPHKPMSQPR
jgi:hypothetical protein